MAREEIFQHAWIRDEIAGIYGKRATPAEMVSIGVRAKMYSSVYVHKDGHARVIS